MNIFKKMASNGAATEAAVIAEIHSSFDRAAEEALVEAQKILSEPLNIDKEHIEALNNAGFYNVKRVREASEAEIRQMEMKGRAKVVEKYSQKYPQYKFIFLDQVDEICRKYSLVCAPVIKYTGDVPKKNALEIAAFSVQEEDKYFHRVELGFTMTSQQLDIYNPYSISSKQEKEEYESSRKQMLPNDVVYGRRDYTPIPLFICAPKDDFNTEGMVQKGNFLVQEVRDPIVLHFVRDGWLVVSKWGLEASDEIVVNQKMN